MQLFLKNYIDNANSVWLNKPFITAFFVCLIVFPLSFVEKMEKLEFSSLLSLVPLAYLMIMQIFTTAASGLAPDLVLAIPYCRTIHDFPAPT